MGGVGAGAIDASLNTYIAQNHSERMMQWLHASFGVGITIGPVIMTLGITGTGSWRPGYTIVMAVQAALGLIFFASKNIWTDVHLTEPKHLKEDASMKESLGSPGVWLSMLLVKIQPVVSVAGICLTGFAVAPIFPGLVSDTENRVGRSNLANTIGIQFAASGIGAAVIPSLAGLLARKWGLEMIPLFVLLVELLLLAGFSFSHSFRVCGKKVPEEKK